MSGRSFFSALGDRTLRRDPGPGDLGTVSGEKEGCGRGSGRVERDLGIKGGSLKDRMFWCYRRVVRGGKGWTRGCDGGGVTLS